MSSEQQLTAEIEKHARALAQAFADAHHWHGRALEIIDQAEQQSKSEIETTYKHAIDSALQSYSETLQRAQAEIASLAAGYQLAELGWEAPAWRQYQPRADAPLPRLTRFGMLTAQGQFDQVQIPALLPIIGERNVLIQAGGAGKERARSVIQAIVLRLLAALPPGKLRLVCIDPVGLGSTVAGFIKGLPDMLTGGQAWFSQRDIEQRLAELETHMAFVKQKYLGVSFASMEDYNAQAGKIEEPYRLLVIADFPARFSDSAAQHLVSIATNGPGTGVYMLAMVDTDQKMPYAFNISDLQRTATLVQANEAQAAWLDDDFKKCQLELDAAPPAADFERWVTQISQATLAASEVRVEFSLPEETGWWRGDSRAGVHVPIGQYGARETQIFALDEKLLSSALVVGKTGSGKSTLLHILVQGLASAYSPDELELYLLDFKQVEFKDYAIHRLPHARVVAVKSEREFGLSVLRGLDAELQRRKDLFGNLTSLSEYRTKTGQTLPRTLLLADEFQELFSYDDALATEAGLILDRLIRQGRAFGLNVLLASQTLAGPNTLAASTKNQIPLRIALQCSDSDSRLVLSDDNDRARLLERPGEAIYNAANGRVEGNNRFQVYWLEDTRESYLLRLRTMADAQPTFAARTPIVFDGDSAAQLENNRELSDLLVSSVWPAPKRGFVAFAWLGEPLEIKPHSSTIFRRQSRSNLLVIGQNEHEEDIMGLMLSAWLSLAAQQRQRNLWC